MRCETNKVQMSDYKNKPLHVRRICNQSNHVNIDALSLITITHYVRLHLCNM